MKLFTLTNLFALSLLSQVCAHAAVSSEEAKALGTSLTGVGADPHANKDGSIPAYTGGLTTPPAGFKAGGERIDPYAAEAPVATITAANMTTYADRLTEGTKAMFKKYPDYKVLVFPTHRTVAMPKFVIDNTAKNAVRAQTNADGTTLSGAYGGVPFPIPKTGAEAIWNHKLRFSFQTVTYDYQNWFVDANGKPTLTVGATYLKDYPYFDPKGQIGDPGKEFMTRARALNSEPARSVGAGTMVHDGLDQTAMPRRAWQYLPGQRRVRAAPDVAFDTPVTSASTYDDIQVFNGSTEKYDWKLVGKKEVYIPYNNYRLVYSAGSADALKPRFLNTDLVRWELHRTWVVEATLKSGQRHIYAKRTFYIDEDSWAALATDIYDASGRLYRTGNAYIAQAYDLGLPFAEPYSIYDMNVGAYAMGNWGGDRDKSKRLTVLAPPAAKEWMPDALLSQSVR